MIPNILFKIDDKPYCCWGFDLPERNEEFINSVDHRYFLYLAGIHSQHLNDDSKQYAAISIRNSLYHALETLFSLLGATLQSPKCVYGWILNASTRQLLNLVKKIQDKDNSIFNLLKLKEISWSSISNKIHKVEKPSVPDINEIAKSYAEIWSYFATLFLSRSNRNEYNSIKHGFRMRFGGSKLDFSSKEENDPKKKIDIRRHSDFGTSFFTSASIKNSPISNNDPNFVTRRNYLNWNPIDDVHALNLIGFSINNIIAFLKAVNSVKRIEVQYCTPTDLEDFKKPLEHLITNSSSVTFDHDITSEHIRFFTHKEIDSRLDDIL